MIASGTLQRHPTSLQHEAPGPLERLIFGQRLFVLVICALITMVLGAASTKLRLNASFEKTLPISHPYIKNLLENRGDLKGQGNAIRIAVATSRGSVFDSSYLDILREINDAVFLLPGVDRPFMKSLWTPATRWTAVTEEGLDGGPVIPDDFDGSPKALQQLRQNLERSGEIGTLVALDLRSSVIYVPLLDRDPATGSALDYAAFTERLEAIRQQYTKEGVTLHVTGFAQVMGDLLHGLKEMSLFFGLAVLITAAAVYIYNRCVRSTLLVVACSLIAVVWLLGGMAILGLALNAYSMLVPFLVFAIGLSHGAQKMNGILQDIGRGYSRLEAAQLTFRRLFAVGLVALLCDAVGFGVLSVIGIPVIRELALVAASGVAILVFTNLILLPVLLSYTGVSSRAARRAAEAEVSFGAADWLWRRLALLGHKGPAAIVIAGAAVLLATGYWVSRELQIGDLDAGAPELRPDSRYNRDTAFIASHYRSAGDVLSVMFKTAPDECVLRANLAAMDDLGWELEQLPGVISTSSLAGLARQVAVGLSEGNFKWWELANDQAMINPVMVGAPRELVNATCDLAILNVSLADRKAATLDRVVAHVEQFAAANQLESANILLAGGNAGVEAATNIVVRQAWWQMLAMVYGVVAALCALTFRDWRPVVVALLPLVLTSVLCEALMVALGMGVKVATLPVIAVGVGIGVDYALYLLGILLREHRAGADVSLAYLRALRFTGKVVVLTGLTLSLAVSMWVFSDIRFQADMGLLLAFMFLANMVFAMLLVPALCAWLYPVENSTHTQGASS